MVDKVTVDNGTLTDYDVAGDKVTTTQEFMQTVKLAQSAAGVATPIPADAAGLMVQPGAPFAVTSNTPLQVTNRSMIFSVVDGYGLAVQGAQPHNTSTTVNPVLVGGRTNFGTPGGTTNDANTAHLWLTRNGAAVAQLLVGTAEGTPAQVPGDSANGVDVDVTRVQGTVAIAGNVASGATDSGNPVKMGGKAQGAGTAPTAVSVGQRVDLAASRQGIQYVIGGYPDVQTVSARITGANTDVAILAGTIATGQRVVVTRMTVRVGNNVTNNPGIRIGFGATTLAADSTTGANGILYDNDAEPPGGGFNSGDGSGVLGIGGDGEEIRITNDAPSGGTINVTATFHITPP